MVAYFRVVDAVKSVVAIESVGTAINQIAQTTLRKVVGQHTLDEKRAKIIAAEGEALAADALFPAPLMSTIGELGSFLARESTAALNPGEPNGKPLAPTGPVMN